MNYQRILVPYDGSEHAKAAFGAARDLALSSDSTTVYVVNVVPMASASAFGSTDPVTGGPSPFVDQEGYAALFDDALSTIKKEVVSDVEGLLDGLSADSRRGSASIRSPRHRRIRRRPRLRPYRDGTPRPGRRSRDAWQRKLRRVALRRHSRLDREVA